MFEDKTLVCRDCGKEFVFSASEQQFFADKGFQNDPTRCHECRAARRNRENPGRAERQYYEVICDGASEFVTRLFHLHRPSCTRYESVFAAAMEEAGLQFKRLTRSISFGLIMFCLGLFVTLAYLLWL